MEETGPDREDIMPTAAPEQVAWQSAYRIEEDGDDLVIRIPKSLANRDRVQQFLDRIEFEYLRSQSQLTAEDAAELTAEVKRAVAEANRHHGKPS
ncbi:MAG TPA: hypothetical protein VHG08_25555 [Longimicrobium sp.]|nr:hypothetical protein [Longimicrobium sp.]